MSRIQDLSDETFATEKLAGYRASSVEIDRQPANGLARRARAVEYALLDLFADLIRHVFVVDGAEGHGVLRVGESTSTTLDSTW